MKLDGTTALVTGASRGIGRALVEELARRPLKTILAGMREPSDFVPVVGAAADVRPVRMDLSSAESIEGCIAECNDEFQALDMLINNAGMLTGGLLEDQDTTSMYSLFQVNLVGAVHLIQRALPGMLARGRGRIVNNASIGAYAVFPVASTYSASKTALVALTVALNRELSGTGVEAVYLVTPGVDTQLLDDSESIFSRYTDTSHWERMSPGDWAAHVVSALEHNESVVLPTGASATDQLLRDQGTFAIDPIVDRTFSRVPRQ